MSERTTSTQPMPFHTTSMTIILMALEGAFCIYFIFSCFTSVLFHLWWFHEAFLFWEFEC